MTSAPERSYLVCATPRSGSTLLCKALRETGVAGKPEEYFEALRSTGRPRRPDEYFAGVDDQSIRDQLGDPPSEGQAPPPAWSCTAYDRYLEWAMEEARPRTASSRRLGLEVPDDFSVEPRMRSQSDGINDDWARRFSELRLGTEFDLVPAVPEG